MSGLSLGKCTSNKTQIWSP